MRPWDFANEASRLYEKHFGYSHHEAWGRMRAVSAFFLRESRRQIRDLLTDVRRYQAQLAKGWEPEVSDEDTQIRTSWFCLDPDCLVREVSFYHAKPVVMPPPYCETACVLHPVCGFCGSVLKPKYLDAEPRR